MRRRTVLILGAKLAGLAALAGCQGSGSFLGYRFGSAALYDTNIKTIYVPTFNNRAFQTTPFRGLEVDITRAVVREIGTKTPYRIVSDCERADTELKGVVIAIGKNILNRNQQNLPREEEIVITVDVLWRDLRTGKNLSAQRRGNIGNGVPAPNLPPPEPIPFDPSLPLPPAVSPDESWLPVRLVATGRLIPELGESTTTGEQKAINNVAVQIVSMMEKPWDVPGRMR
jgi:hypothetical protein